MPSVLLARHGQASFGAEDYDVLSGLGHRQAAALGAELARRGSVPARVVSGAMRRQRDTAAELTAAAGFSATAEVDPRWDEYDHLALLDHHAAGPLPVAADADGGRAVQRALDGALQAWTAGDCADCGRDWPAFRTETAAALDEMLGGLGSGETGVAVTSGGVIAATVAGLLGLPPEGFVALNRVIANASVTTVIRGRGGTALLAFNEHGHLLGEPGLLSYR